MWNWDVDNTVYHNKLKDLLRNNLDDFVLRYDEYPDDGMNIPSFDDGSYTTQDSLFHTLATFVDDDAQGVLDEIMKQLRTNKRLCDIVDDEYIEKLDLVGEHYQDIGQNEVFAFCAAYDFNIVLFDAIDRVIFKFQNPENQDAEKVWHCFGCDEMN